MSNSHLTGTYLQGKRLYIFGKLAGMSRRDAETLLRAQGGKMTPELNGGVDIIIIGEANPLGTDWLNLTDQFNQATRCSFEQGRLELMTESQLWNLLGLDEVPHSSHPYYTPAMLSELTQIPAAKIRLWLRRGFLRASKIVGKLPYFDFQEILAAQQLKRVFVSGISPENLAKTLTLLRGRFSEIDRPLFHLLFAPDQKTLLMRYRHQLYDSYGQRFFDFQNLEDSFETAGQEAGTREEISGESSTMPHYNEGLLPFSPFSFPVGSSSIDAALALSSVPENDDEVLLNELSERDRLYLESEKGKQIVSLCEKAQEEESLGHFREAVDAYRSALAVGGESADISFQLAELFAATNHLEAARERYYMTLEMEEDHLEARVGLGRVLTELGEFDDAIAAFSGTLAIHPDFLEVRFLLGRLLFQQNRWTEAEEHLLYFKGADPQSPQSQEVDEMLKRIRRSAL